MIKGQEFSHTFQVTESVYRGFIEIFKDKNPLHTDEAFARSKNFQGKVMHGNILNGFLSYFIGECLPDKNVIIQTQEIKFILPVYLDDTLDFHAQIEDVFESVHTLELKFHFSNMEGKRWQKVRYK